MLIQAEHGTGGIGLIRFPMGLAIGQQGLEFKQCSFHHIARVLRGRSLSVRVAPRFPVMLWSLTPFGCR